MPETTYKPGQLLRATVTRQDVSTHYAGKYLRTTTASKGSFIVLDLGEGREVSIRPCNVKPA